MAIVRNRGYVQLRRGLFEHVQNGEMSMGECFLYTAILANADPSTGVWVSSAAMLANYYSIPVRTCKDWLSKLELKRYLRRFMVPGRHAQYPILVHKYQCTEGALKGMRLNAWESETYTSPKYEPCPESAPAGALTVPQSTREEEKQRKIPSSRMQVVDRRTASVERAWAYYCKMFDRGQSYALTTRRKHGERAYDALQKLCSRQLGLPEEKHEDSINAQFEIAIDRMRESAWHNGQNDARKKYNDWENLFRSQKTPSPDHLTDYWLNDSRFGGVQ